MHLFCVQYNWTISLCMYLLLSDILKRVTELTSLPVCKPRLSDDPCYLLLFCQLKSNIKCNSCWREPMLFKWKETSSLYIQFKYQTWSLKAASVCHPYPDRTKGAVICSSMCITWSNTCPQQNAHTQSSEFDPTPVTLHGHTYCFIIVLLFSSI